MDGTNFGQRAHDLIEKANKTLKGSFFGNFTRSKQDRADEAKDLYLQAANCFKLTGDWKNALSAYEHAIKCEESEADAAPHFREAANVVKEHDSDKYLELVKKAIDLYSLTGRASTGAQMSRDCA